MRISACLLLLALLSPCCQAFDTTSPAPRDSAFGFLTARNFETAKKYLSYEAQSRLNDFEPEVLDSIFAIGMRRLNDLTGSVTAVDGPTKEGDLKISFGPRSWLQFHLDNESSATDKAVVDFSITYFKDGSQVNDSPFASRLVMDMALQSGTWRIGRMVVTGPLNLFDKNVLDNLSHAIVSRNEASAVGAIRWINNSEITFATKNPKQGFTCDKTQLASFVPGPEAESIKTTVMKDGSRNGYSFRFGGCEKDGQSYRISAQPIRPGHSGNRSFCSDESGIIYFSTSGSADACLTEKNPI